MFGTYDALAQVRVLQPAEGRPVPQLTSRGSAVEVPYEGMTPTEPAIESNGAPEDESTDAGLFSSVTEIEFGQVKVGETVEGEIFLTHNGLDGDEPITIYSVYLDEPTALAFGADFDGPVVIETGESHIIDLTFTPQEVGESVGSIFVSHSGQTNIEVFTLSGFGTGDQRMAFRAIAEPEPVWHLRMADPVGFGRSELSGFGDIKPTTLQFGPDDRLYVADWQGEIEIYDVVRNGLNDYSASVAEVITSIRDIPNHNDDGAPNSKINNRLVTGLLVTGTANNPIVYVASSDPRIGGGPSHNDTNLDTNSGVLSRLTWNGSSWDKLDLVRGMPRSEENHHTNGMALDESTNTLYLTAGGNTNQGATSNNFALLPEYALSAAILRIDLNAIGNETHDLPTLDDETRPGSVDDNDPFGGNSGRNQAMLVPGNPVQVHAPGFRNAYDVVMTEAGQLWTIDNGANSGWGAQPIGVGTDSCTNEMNEPGNTQKDRLHNVTQEGYYGGHSNPTRGNTNNTFNEGNPQSPVSQSNPIECTYVGAGSSSGGQNFGTSTNGIAEYTASNFGGAMQGDLLAAGHGKKMFRIELNAAGDEFVQKSEIFTQVGKKPLDVVAQGDDDIFPGTIWLAEFVEKKIFVFEPNDYDGTPPQCDGLDQPIDEDNDGYNNDDEIDNGTDPCSAADLPSDADGDNVSDLNDTDDDNDGLDDLQDPFALDPANGRDRPIPLSYPWENNSDPAGFLFNVGFSGLMIDGETDYLDQFDDEEITAVGAAGVFTVDNIPQTTASGGRNDQTYAFQFGIDVGPQSPEFEVRTRVLAPFSGVDDPTPEQSIGLYIGTGDQDNYIKLVANAFGDGGGVGFVSEVGGAIDPVAQVPADVYGAESIDLFLTVDPAAGTVSASYELVDGGTTGPRVPLGVSTNLPSAWLTADTGLAVGIIGTSVGASPFIGTWDFVEIVTSGNQAPTVEAGADASVEIGATLALAGSASDDGLPSGALATAWSQTGGPGTASFAEAAAPDSTVSFDAAGTYELTLVADDGELASEDTVSVTVSEGGGGGGGNGPDADGDGNPDATDPDDDNDGKPDTSDPFAVDADNGRTTDLPLELEWNGGEGALLDSGFTGLMSNGQDYRELFEPSRVSVGGGELRVIEVPKGDPFGGRDTAEYGLQLGLDVSEESAPFTVHTRVLEPFANTTPKKHQSLGVYIGTGDQDNYIKLIANISAGPDGGVEMASEVGGAFASVGKAGAEVIGAGSVDLYLTVDPGANTVSGAYQVDGGPVVALSGTATLPAGWLYGGGDGLAVGLISSSFRAETFDARWDFLRVDYSGAAPSNRGPTVEAGADASVEIGATLALAGSASDDGLPSGALTTAWSQTGGPGTASFAEAAAPDSTVSFDAAGTYELTLVADDGELASEDTVSVTVSEGGGGGGATNEAPTVEAGADASVEIGSTLALAGSASDDGLPSGALTTAWSQTGGPGTASFAEAAAPDSTVSFDAAGTYELTLAADDGELAGEDTVSVTVSEGDGGGGATNEAPTVEAGADASVEIGATLALAGSASDDGLPSGALATAWSQTGGPGTASFAEATAPDSTVSFDAAGTYELTLAADDGELASEDTVSVTVSDGGGLSAATSWRVEQSSDGSEPIARHEAGGVSLGGKLYLLGGRRDRQTSIYDPASRTWTVGAAPPIEMHHFQPVVWGNKIYVIGAMTCCYPDEPTVTDIYSYTPATDSWQVESSMPAERARGSVGAVVHAGKIYLVGGNTRGHSGGAVNWFDEYDPATDRWTPLPSAPTPRDHAPVAVVDGKLVVAGGRQSDLPDVFDKTVAPVEVYDFASGSWSTETDIPTQRAGSVAVVVNGEVVIIGGEAASQRAVALSMVESFDVTSGTWRTLQPLAQGMHSGGGAVFANRIHIMSGSSRNGGGGETTLHQTLPFGP